MIFGFVACFFRRSNNNKKKNSGQPRFTASPEVYHTEEGKTRAGSNGVAWVKGFSHHHDRCGSNSRFRHGWLALRTKGTRSQTT